MNLSKFTLAFIFILCTTMYSFSFKNFENSFPKNKSAFIPITISSQVVEPTDDVEEDALSGIIDFSSPNLDLVFENAKEQTIGLRFTNIDIPQYAQITNAYIQFTASDVNTAPAKFSIRAEATKDATPFSTSGCNISSRPTTLSSVIWVPEAWQEIGDSSLAQRTPNIASLLQEVVSRHDWIPTNSMAFLITGMGKRTAFSFDGCTECAPKLVIEYETGCLLPPATLEPFCIGDSSDFFSINISGPPVNVFDDPYNGPFGVIATIDSSQALKVLVEEKKRLGPFPNNDTTDLFFYSIFDPTCNFTMKNITYDCKRRSAFSKIKIGTDDAEEMMSTGDVFLISGDLNMVEKPSGNQLVGLRFQDLQIPQGAEIQNAYIQFTADEVGTDDAHLLIRAEDEDHALTFQNEFYDLSSRTFTDEEATWIPKDWNTVGEVGSCQQTSDISNVIQEVVNRVGWTEESALALFIDGEGVRTAESFEGCASCAAELFVDYTVRCEKPETEVTLVCDPTNEEQFYVKVAIIAGVDTAYALDHNLTNETDTIYVGDGVFFGPYSNNTVIDLTLTSLSDSTCVFYFLNMTKVCGCTNKRLEEVRYIKTTPFVNTNFSLKDGEGMAFVPVDKSLWLGDDNGQQVVEVDYLSGDLKQVIPDSIFENTPQFGGNNVAGPTRVQDIEAIAYDAKIGELFVFSGACCPGDGTVFRLLKNQQGIFEPSDFQPLSPPTDDFAGAAVHPTLGILLGNGKTIHQYDYLSNTFLNSWNLLGTGFNGTILGLGIADDGNTLWVTSDTDRLFKFNWNTLQIIETYNLIDVDIFDARAVEYLFNQIYLLDGFNTPPNPDKKFAVTVFDIECDTMNFWDDIPIDEYAAGQVDENIFSNKKNTISTLSVFPNPTSNFLSVKISKGKFGTAQIRVFDTFGRQLLETPRFEIGSGEEEKQINVGDLPKGTYTLSVQMFDGTLISKFFVKN